jgi:hypothetical protein
MILEGIFLCGDCVGGQLDDESLDVWSAMSVLMDCLILRGW